MHEVQYVNVCRSICMAMVLVVLTSATANADASWGSSTSPSVKTITLGSPLSLVLKQLGQPLKTVAVQPSEMGMPASQDLYYEGVVIGVYPSSPDREAHVWSVRVTGENVAIYPGIFVGMTRDELVDLLGPPYSDEARDDARWMFWRAPEPVAIFHLRLKNNRVIEFAMMEDWS